MSSVNLLTPYDTTLYNTTSTSKVSPNARVSATDDTLLGYTENGTSMVTGANNASKDMFLQLLVAQMSNLDPFGENQDPTQYITQLAQFTTLEQMQSMNTALENLSVLTNGLLINSAVSTSSELLGRNAEFLKVSTNADGTTNNETVKGRVTGVYVENGLVYMEALLENGETQSFAYEAFVKVTE